MIVSFIDAHREEFGVEPICTQLQTAPSWYYEQKARQVDPARVPARTQRDAQLRPEITRVWHANRRVYGAKKVWKALHRDGRVVARCTVARLMQADGQRGWCAGVASRRRSRMGRLQRPRIWCNGILPPRDRTPCGLRTSPTSPPGVASCTSPS